MVDDPKFLPTILWQLKTYPKVILPIINLETGMSRVMEDGFVQTVSDDFAEDEDLVRCFLITHTGLVSIDDKVFMQRILATATTEREIVHALASHTYGLGIRTVRSQDVYDQIVEVIAELDPLQLSQALSKLRQQATCVQLVQDITEDQVIELGRTKAYKQRAKATRAPQEQRTRQGPYVHDRGL